MLEQERRSCRRYSINFPVIISSTRALESSEGYHYGKILDAGKEGVRIRVENFGSLAVGSILQMVCQPAANRRPNNKCMPVPIKGRVVWQDAQSKQFALQYMH
jgi:hypothetical protein